jgi:hypothetical protein
MGKKRRTVIIKIEAIVRLEDVTKIIDDVEKYAKETKIVGMCVE